MSETKTPYKTRGSQHGGSRPVVRPNDGRTVKRLVEQRQLLVLDGSNLEADEIKAGIPNTRQRTLILLNWIADQNESKEQSK